MTPVFETHYVQSDADRLFTMVLRPQEEGRYPIVFFRSPYEDYHKTLGDDELKNHITSSFHNWTDNGYVLVFGHCRGTGKSTGDSDAFVNERRDGRAALEWIRKQSFYGGEIYLTSGSYCGFVHLSLAPFEHDIKGLVLEATDPTLYNWLYLNGTYRTNLHGGWYVGRYKTNGSLKKNFTTEAFLTLPMTEYSEKVFGEKVATLDEMLLHPDVTDEFWNTEAGGVHQRNALDGTRVPILVTTGFFDIFSRGGHETWDRLTPEQKSRSAFVIHPYHHGGTSDGQPYHFPRGTIEEFMGDFEMRWFEHIRKNTPPPAPLGKISYYELFENKWLDEGYFDFGGSYTFTLGEGERSYDYDPRDPARYSAGLSNNFGGTEFMASPSERDDIITCYTPVFESDVHVRGSMTASLRVKSDREDTAFYIRIGLCKKEGDFALRDSITKISNFHGNYIPGDEITLDFVFDRGAFKIEKGERLRIDVSSSAFPQFLPHTNNRGLFTVQTEALVAKNTVILEESVLTVPHA